MPAILLAALKRAWPYLAFLALLVICSAVVYNYGHKHGSQEVRLAWELDKSAARAAHDALVQELERRDALHRTKQQEVESELVRAREAHAVAVDRLRADFDRRLVQSARRAAVYQRQAEAGSDSARGLAGHAARLDRALEEGRGLVQELRGALGLREHQLRLLGAQIRADRELLEGGGPNP